MARAIAGAETGSALGFVVGPSLGRTDGAEAEVRMGLGAGARVGGWR